MRLTDSTDVSAGPLQSRSLSRGENEGSSGWREQASREPVGLITCAWWWWWGGGGHWRFCSVDNEVINQCSGAFPPVVPEFESLG